VTVAITYLMENEESVPVAVKSVKSYRRDLRAVVRGLWSGILTFDQAADSMDIAIERNLTQAWNQGARECGIRPDELSEDELDALQERITDELVNLSGFLLVIQEKSKANGGKLAPLFRRVELWVNRFPDIQNQAKTMACADEKLIWVLGRVEKHCRTCLKLAGKVKRASFWLRSGIRPQNPPNEFLECGGWRCDCRLSKTDKPVSKGPLPRF
jgi:hypothetical protein